MKRRNGCSGRETGESRRRTRSVKEEGSRCVKIYEHFFSLESKYKRQNEVDVTGENCSFRSGCNWSFSTTSKTHGK